MQRGKIHIGTDGVPFLAKTYSNIRISSDDASQDNTPLIIQEYQERFPRKSYG